MRMNSKLLRVLVTFGLLATCLMLLLSPFTAMATGGNFITRILASNVGAAAANIWQTFELSTADMITAGMLNSTATDVTIKTSGGTEVEFMPGLDDPWAVHVPSIGAYSQSDLYIYSGNVTSGLIRYFPGDAGMTVSDNDTSLEPSDNFTMVQSGWINTDNGTDKYLFRKGYSIETYISPTVTGNVTTRVAASGVSGHTNIGTVADGWGAYVEQSYAETQVGGLRIRIKNNYSGVTYQVNMCQVWDSGCSEWVTPTSVSDAGSWTSSSNAIDGDTGTYASHAYSGSGVYSTYLTLELPFCVTSTKVRTWVSYSGVAPSAFVRDTDYGDGYSDYIISVTEVASGNHTVTTSLVSGNLTLQIDSETPVWTAFAGNVPNTTANWAFFQNGSMPFVESASIDIGGVTKGAWAWEYGTYFYDSSGYGNTATPTFRTTDSNSDVTLTVQSQAALAGNPEPASQVSGGWTMAGDIPVQPTDLYHEGGIAFPGGAEINQLATDTRLPYMAWMIPIAFGSAILCSVLVYSKMHNTRRGQNGSLFIMWLTFTVVMVIWYIGGGGVMPGWVLIPPGLWGILLMVWFNPFKTPIGG